MQTTPITILIDEQLGPAVSGRELMGLIHVSTATRDTFTDWFKDRIESVSLQEDTDFVRTTVRLADHNRPMTEYVVSVAAAIRIAQWQPVKRGLPVMRYLQTYQQNPAIVTTPPLAAGPQPAPTLLSESTPSAGEVGTVDALPQPDGYRFEQAPLPAEPARPKTQAEQLLEQVTQLVEDEKKRAAEPQPALIDTEAVLQRLSSVEGNFNAIVGIIQQAATGLAGLLPMEVPAADPQAPPTTRVLLTRLVNSYAAADRKTEHEVWRYLYGQFDLRAGVNAYAQAAGKTGGQSYLAVIESGGQIEDLYALAKKLLVLPALH